MKKKELINLIRETIYSEIPDIISEIKRDLRNEMLAEAHKRVAINDAPVKSNNKSQTPTTIQRGGIMEWFKEGVESGATSPTSEFKHSSADMSSYLSKHFGKNIQ